MEFKENSSSQEQIIQHLEACDPEFYRVLSGRVDIKEYSRKLAEKSFRHEAWQGGELVGLVAVYYNHDPSIFDFITDVSVVQSYLGQGIASKLLESCIAKSKTGGASELRLEVDPKNRAALDIYGKFGFILRNKAISVLVLGLPFQN